MLEIQASLICLFVCLFVCFFLSFFIYILRVGKANCSCNCVTGEIVEEEIHFSI